MFVRDIFRRRRAVQHSSAFFLFSRKLAQDAAHQMSEGEDRDWLLSRCENRVREWLSGLKTQSPRALRGHMEQIRILGEHYSQLLQAEGASHSGLVRNALGTRENYETYLSRVAVAEGEVDRAVDEILGVAAEFWARLRAEQVLVAQLREKGMDRIFSQGGDG